MARAEQVDSGSDDSLLQLHKFKVTCRSNAVKCHGELDKDLMKNMKKRNLNRKVRQVSWKRTQKKEKKKHDDVEEL